MKLKLKKHKWQQIGGDINPGAHGAIIARCEGYDIELIEIQPVREYVGDREAIEVGFPFWSKEACYTIDDLSPDKDEVKKALSCCGLTVDELDEMKPHQRCLAIAECMMRYGHSNEACCGYAKDVLGGRRVKWWRSKRACGWRYLADEDREFRGLLREYPDQ